MSCMYVALRTAACEYLQVFYVLLKTKYAQIKQLTCLTRKTTEPSRCLSARPPPPPRHSCSSLRIHPFFIAQVPSRRRCATTHRRSCAGFGSGFHASTSTECMHPRAAAAAAAAAAGGVGAAAVAAAVSCDIQCRVTHNEH